MSDFDHVDGHVEPHDFVTEIGKKLRVSAKTCASTTARGEGVNDVLLMEVAFRLRAGIRHDPESGTFVAYCPALDIYSAGKDLASAKAAINGAVKLFLEACWSRGQFEAMMQRRNFRVDSDRRQGDAARAAEITAIRQAEYDTIVDLDVPLSLIGREHPEAWLH